MPKRTLIILLAAFVLLLGATYALFPPGAKQARSTPTPDLATSGDLVSRGAVLFQQFHCTACHTVDGTRAAGPTLKGLYGSTVVLDSGQTVVADSDYIRESIVDPDAKVRRGYAPQVMGSATDEIRDQLLADDNVNALVAYIESLK